MKDKPAISVIMSTYNEPLTWINKSITSILNQTFKDFEFIIINDNPPRDDLRKFLKNYEKKDKRIVLIKNAQNIGITNSLNKGLKIAKGKYIARMDADDISLKERFQIQYNYLEKYKKIFLVSTCAININELGEKIGRHYIYPFPKIIAWRLKKKCCLIHPTIMFRNEGILYNPKLKYAQDYGFYLSLVKNKKKLLGIPRFLLKYRVSKLSITGKNKKEQDYFVRLGKSMFVN